MVPEMHQTIPHYPYRMHSTEQPHATIVTIGHLNVSCTGKHTFSKAENVSNSEERNPSAHFFLRKSKQPACIVIPGSDKNDKKHLNTIR
jgi:hypothetical protein